MTCSHCAIPMTREHGDTLIVSPSASFAPNPRPIVRLAPFWSCYRCGHCEEARPPKKGIES